MSSPIQADSDRFRVSAYYDEQGRPTKVDIIINADATVGELAVLADCLRRTPGPLGGAPAATHIAWNGPEAVGSGAVVHTFSNAAA